MRGFSYSKIVLYENLPHPHPQSIMRMYQGVWKKLKSDPTQPVIISAHPSLHPRIYKAIVKEKWMDSLHQLDCDFKGFTSRLSHTSSGNALTVTLRLIPTTPETLF